MKNRPPAAGALRSNCPKEPLIRPGINKLLPIPFLVANHRSLIQITPNLTEELLLALACASISAISPSNHHARNFPFRNNDAIICPFFNFFNARDALKISELLQTAVFLHLDVMRICGKV